MRLFLCNTHDLATVLIKAHISTYSLIYTISKYFVKGKFIIILEKFWRSQTYVTRAFEKFSLNNAVGFPNY